MAKRQALSQWRTRMGMTIEFYAADPQALVALFTGDLASEEENKEAFFEQVKAYPMADFSLHLQIPEDLDSLCQFLHKHNPLIPSVFREVLVEQIWDDGPLLTESLTVLSDQFVERLAELDEHAMEKTARDWAATFPYQEPPWQTPAYRALWQLQEVARDTIAQKQFLVLHLAGHLLF
jgi:hypothetical protein